MEGRPTWLEIDLDAIVHNFHVAKQASGDQTAVFPVIKANAYGLGAVPIAQALIQAGANGFCVALVEEARVLRQAGIEAPLVLLSGFTPGVEQAIIDLDVQPVLFEMEAARRLSRLCTALGVEVSLHIKVDTGMGRMGFAAVKIPAILEELERLPGLRLIGILSHLACADDLAGTQTASQLALMHNTVKQADGDGGGLIRSMANSAGVLGHPATRLDWIRPGILLYGASPFFPERSWKQDGLRPVVRWVTHLVAIREVAAGTPLGYGHDFVTRRFSRIGVLPVGYADGLSRCVQNRAWVLTHQHRVPVVGRVSMDLTMVDLTDFPEVSTGSRVTLLGEEGQEFIGVEEMATWMETIPYEVLCRLGARLPRYHLTANKPFGTHFATPFA
ncbi:MAG: alanine racemase [Magnetococcus sp. YQC-5]